MKKINLLIMAMCLALCLKAQTSSDFENLSLPDDSFWDGSDLTGGFTSGNAYFVSDYYVPFSLWGGFGYSNKKDTQTAGYTNPFSAITGEGFYGSPIYAVGNLNGQTKIRLTGLASGKVPGYAYITNSTYAYLSMRDGDAFSKKFGGPSGNDEDWFKLTIKGWLHGIQKPNQVDFYLADFRATDHNEDYIVNTWERVDLRPLGNVDSIQFFLSSTDNGMYGMNTPAYFCMDNFTTTDSANTAPVATDDYINVNYLEDTLIDVLANDLDNTFGPVSVEIIGAPMIPGAYAADSNSTHIYYEPAVGIVAFDTLYYRVCDVAMECDTGRLIVDISSIQGVEEVALMADRVYPNPFSNSFYLDGPAVFDRLKLYDLHGREVMPESQVLAGINRISIAELAQGVYFLHLLGYNVDSIVKVVKQ